MIQYIKSVDLQELRRSHPIPLGKQSTNPKAVCLCVAQHPQRSLHKESYDYKAGRHALECWQYTARTSFPRLGVRSW